MHAFDQAIDHYIDLALEEEKANYSSTLEPFAQHAERQRQAMTEKLYQLKSQLVHGYELLLHEIEQKGKVEQFRIKEEQLSLIDSFEKLTQFYGEGKALYELFGYTPEMLTTLYNAAYEIVEQQRFAEGADAYLFLVQIAPGLRAAWLNFGYTLCKLGDYLSGIEAFGCAYELDPTQADSYLATAGAYLQLQEYENAREVCVLGLEFAREFESEPWAQELQAQLEEAERQIS